MRARQARFDGAFCPQTLHIHPAVAALQMRPAGGLIEPDKRADAVARTLSSVSTNIPIARGQILIIGELAVALFMASDQRPPANQLCIQRHQERNNKREDALHVCMCTSSGEAK